MLTINNLGGCVDKKRINFDVMNGIDRGEVAVRYRKYVLNIALTYII